MAIAAYLSAKKGPKDETVRSADKKPQKYLAPDGRIKIRMIPVDREIIGRDPAMEAKEMSPAVKAFLAKGGKIKKLPPGKAAGYHGKDDPGKDVKGVMDRPDTDRFSTRRKVKSMESAEGHFMYKDGKKVMVKTKADHDKYAKMGYTMDEAHLTGPLNKKDKPFVADLVKKLRKGSKTHAKQADDLEKAMNTEAKVNELSPATMNRYKKAAGRDQYDASSEIGRISSTPGLGKRYKDKAIGDAEKRREKRVRGLNLATKRSGTAGQQDEKHMVKDKKLKNLMVPNKKDPTAYQKAKEIMKNRQKNEVSADKLSSYMSKASDASKHRGMSTRKVDNRYSGVAMAQDKLAKSGMMGTTAQKVSKAKVGAGRSMKEDTNFEVNIEGLPMMFMSGMSPGEIKAKLRGIVKQPSMINSVKRVTDATVRKTFRLKAQGKDEEEASENYKYDYGSPESVRLMKKITPGQSNKDD